MNNNSKDSGGGNFALTDHVLLLFNEHDSRIALNWESYTPKSSDREAVTPSPGALRS